MSRLQDAKPMLSEERTRLHSCLHREQEVAGAQAVCLGPDVVRTLLQELGRVKMAV